MTIVCLPAAENMCHHNGTRSADPQLDSSSVPAEWPSSAMVAWPYPGLHAPITDTNLPVNVSAAVPVSFTESAFLYAPVIGTCAHDPE